MLRFGGSGRASSIGLYLAEYFMKARPAKIAVNKEDAVALLRERERIIRAGKTLALVRQRTREKKDFAF